MTDDGEELANEKNQPLVWVTVEDLDPDDGERVVQKIEQALPDHEVIVTTNRLDLIDATEMKDVLERMIDDAE